MASTLIRGSCSNDTKQPTSWLNSGDSTDFKLPCSRGCTIRIFRHRTKLKPSNTWGLGCFTSELCPLWSHNRRMPAQINHYNTMKLLVLVVALVATAGATTAVRLGPSVLGCPSDTGLVYGSAGLTSRLMRHKHGQRCRSVLPNPPGAAAQRGTSSSSLHLMHSCLGWGCADCMRRPQSSPRQSLHPEPPSKP